MTQPKEAALAESKRTPVVLLVDDDETLRQLIADFLEKHGMEVLPVAGRPGGQTPCWRARKRGCGGAGRDAAEHGRPPASAAA